ncbi:MAG: thiamine phosphate synthase [Campylobacteraceae bacterium]|jgi:thiamine-phosphate pyrophosphorylase|nr:thiamine phosphate synthase [Campylobacteraceae bacterium]
MTAYLITDPISYGHTPNSLTSTLYEAAKYHTVNYACLRDKSAENYDELSLSFIAAAKELGIKPILHTFWQKAAIYGAFGVHFGTVDFQNIPFAKEQGLFVVASTHSLEEALTATSLGADFVTISPVFYTPNKNKPLGLEKLKEITDKIPDKCIALGGILHEEQIQECINAGAVGFASIRYFLK